MPANVTIAAKAQEWLKELRACQDVRTARAEHEKDCPDRWGLSDQPTECDHSCHDRSTYIVIGDPHDVQTMIDILEGVTSS